MAKLSKKNLLLIIIIAAAVIALVVILCNISGTDDQKNLTVKESEVTLNDITTTISGSGQLKDTQAVAVTVPEGVEISEYLVKNNDEVTEGQALAVADRVSVMNSIASVEDTLDYLEKQMESTDRNLSDETVKAPTSGKVVKIFAETGDDVKSVISENGALMLLSADGKMIVSFESSESFKAGDDVTVELSDGIKVKGSVDSVVSGTVTVIIPDSGCVYGDNVKVLDSEGTVIGEGELKVHSEWRAVAQGGTVKSIPVKEGDTVKAGDRLVEISAKGTTADFNVYSAKHRVYEEILKELFILYQDQTVFAEKYGFVTGIDETDVIKLSSDSNYDGGFVLLAAHTPDTHDEKTYIN